MLIAMTSGLVGIAVYFASNQAFSMLSLSDQYAAATTDAQRSAFLAAGEALLAITQGSGILLSLFLVLLAGLITSLAMLRSSMRSRVFGRATAYVGILANASGLGYFVALVFAPAMIAVPHVIAGPFRMIWYLLIARELFRLGRNGLGERNTR
jgi:hypothetical protein